MAFDPAAFFDRIDEVVLGAIVETMVLAASADGDFDDGERTELAAQLRTLAEGTPLAAAVAGDALEAALGTAVEELARDGRQARLSSVKTRLEDARARKGALALAMRVVASDGVIRTSERELLMDLAEGLDIDRDEAADLVRDLSRPTQG
jgi:uncharacterized membrane protein YebE (DUF533 family)